MLTLYTNPQSRGQTVRWMLEEVGADYEARELNYEGDMKTPDYLAINPMGKVPALVHETASGRQVVTESAACCAYLADAFPEAGMAPPPAERGAYYRWLFFAAGPIEAAMLDRFRKLENDEKMQLMAGYGTWDRSIAAFSAAVEGREWIAGDRFSAADVYAGSAVDWPAQFGMFTPSPALGAYLDRLRARPAYQRVNAK